MASSSSEGLPGLVDTDSSSDAVSTSVGRSSGDNDSCPSTSESYEEDSETESSGPPPLVAIDTDDACGPALPSMSAPAVMGLPQSHLEIIALMYGQEPMWMEGGELVYDQEQILMGVSSCGVDDEFLSASVTSLFQPADCHIHGVSLGWWKEWQERRRAEHAPIQ